MSILKDRVSISRNRIDLSLDHSNFEILMSSDMHIDDSFDNTSNISTYISMVYSFSENTASNVTASLFKRLCVKHTGKLMNLREQVNEYQFSIFFINSFLIHTFAGVSHKINSALSNMKSNTLELVSDDYTLVTINEHKKFVFKLNQVFLDRNPLQREALLQPHQMRAFGVMVDDCSRSHLGPSNRPGGKCIIVNNIQYDMHFDGWKCYFQTQKPTHNDLRKYPIVELTSGLAYEPQRLYSRRVQGKLPLDLSHWRYRLGFPSFEVAKVTLANTTNLIQTLKAETREYTRDH